MHIALDRDRPAALPRQIQAHFERLIREGVLRPGTKLPATRELARTLGVNRATVALAYEELCAAGLTRAHVGQGTFVAERPAAAPRTAGNGRPGRVDWGALVSRAARTLEGEEEPWRAALAAAGPGVISFAGGMPDSGLFPTDAFRRALNRVVREEGEALLQYYPVRGYRPLREYLAGYLLRFGVEAQPDDLLIVNGSQQGFDLIARTLVDPGDPVAVEQPTYPRALSVFRAFGAHLLPVPWEAGGPRVEAFEHVVERHAPKLFYCQPNAHNPTGLAMSPAVQQRLLEAAAARQVPVVEDGFDATLNWGPRPAVPLKAADRDGVVIYIGTFSKILFPGLRLGWLLAPPAILPRLVAAKQAADLHTSALLQAAVHRFCQQRLLDRHAARARAEYARRRTLLLQALARRMPPEARWTEPAGGFSLLLTLPPGLDGVTLLAEAIERGVAFTPGAPFFPDGSGAGTVRLSFSAVPAARIDEGVRRLAETLRAARERTGRRPRAERVAAPVV